MGIIIDNCYGEDVVCYCYNGFDYKWKVVLKTTKIAVGEKKTIELPPNDDGRYRIVFYHTADMEGWFEEHFTDGAEAMLTPEGTISSKP